MSCLEAKVVILGAQGAGKTSLVVRFVENNFHRNLQSTIGASFWSKCVPFPPFLVLGLTGCRQVDDCVVRLQVRYFRMVGDRGFGIPRDKNGFDRW